MRVKKYLGIFLLVFGILFVTSCNFKKHYNYEDYIAATLDYKDNFKILQLTDTHIAAKDDRERQYNFIKDIILEASADLIVITGDVFTFATKESAKEFFSFLDSCGTLWTLTFGNHDEQCYFSITWLTSYLNGLSNSSSSNCIFKDIIDDDITGNSNFVINLVEGNIVKEQLILIDSNRYQYGPYVGYDYIHEDQVEWYKNIVNETKTSNGGVLAESICFFHIPLPEWLNAYSAYNLGKAEAIWLGGEWGEASCVPDINTGLFDVIKELGSTKAIFCGHDHLNDYAIKYQGIIISYGVTSTDRIYFSEEKLGGQIITVNFGSDPTIDRIIKSYEDY